MILPEGVKKLNEHSERSNELFGNAPKIEQIQTSAMTSNKVPDVEYDEDYEDDNFNQIPSMSLKVEEKVPTNNQQFKAEPIRDFSIYQWNGSPGLKHWGYNDSNHERFITIK